MEQDRAGAHMASQAIQPIRYQTSRFIHSNTGLSKECCSERKRREMSNEEAVLYSITIRGMKHAIFDGKAGYGYALARFASEM